MRRAAISALFILSIAACKSRSEKAQELVLEGNAKLEAKDVDGADGAFARALEQVPDYPEALAGRGRVALAKDDADRARSLVARCNAPPCASVRADASMKVRDRLAQGSLEGEDGPKLIDAAVDASSAACGLLFAMVQIEEREKKGKPAPPSFVAEVKRRVEGEAVGVDASQILGGLRLARSTGKALGGMTTCEELGKAERDMEAGYRNVLSVTGMPDPGSSEERQRVLVSYALRAVLARVTKTPPPRDPDERGDEERASAPDAGDGPKAKDASTGDGSAATGPLPLPF